jgi:hypothetical protein
LFDHVGVAENVPFVELDYNMARLDANTGKFGGKPIGVFVVGQQVMRAIDANVYVIEIVVF